MKHQTINISPRRGETQKDILPIELVTLRLHQLVWTNISIMLRKFLSTTLILIPIVVMVSCGNSKPSSNGSAANAPQAPPAPSPKTGFEKDLDYVRKGQYTYVWVFSRKDGKPIDKDDAAYLRTTAPQVVDWVSSDEGKKVIAGTNFDLEQGNMELLRKRFVVEDYTGK